MAAAQHDDPCGRGRHIDTKDWWPIHAESGLSVHFWALLAEIGRSEGNSTRFSQIQVEVYKTDTRPLLQFT